jgi:ABC-type thiamine transport system ATPase subunit
MKKSLSALDQKLYYEMCRVVNRCITFRTVADVVVKREGVEELKAIKKFTIILNDEEAQRIYEIANAKQVDNKQKKVIS